MTETHFEPYVHLVDVGPDRALIAWGGFWFRRPDAGSRWQLVDDEQLDAVDEGRTGTIGAGSRPYGEAVVEVLDTDGGTVARAATGERNHAWVGGLAPDTRYRYRITVDGRSWAEGERWDWGPVPRGGLDLRPAGRRYDLTFRTHPAPDARAPLAFAVLGDYGVGVVVDSEGARRQRRVAQVLDRLADDPGVRLVLSTGDNVYEGESGRTTTGTGAADADWFSSFYQPYRYLLARVPVYPTVGNHDTSDSESSDDREQIRGNFHTDLRFTPESAGERASIDPGMFYRFRYGADVEFVCIDTSLADPLPTEHFFENPRHRAWLDRALPADDPDGPTWRLPFSHHPTYCAGPHHSNTESMVRELAPRFRRAGVRAAFAGHEHNFQLSRVDGIDYFLSGAGGQLREDPPTDFAAAGTVAWAAHSHVLLAEIDGDRLVVTPFSGVAEDGGLQPMTALSPDDGVVEVPFVVTAG
ncbi:MULTISPECIES: metallophosphoesterase [unclassified Modestobacter]|uniref:metallophosphoesterase n=1 Tax=unclassified Modestobacter TaxID=2643866 RepID=UPI0022AA48C7|nr:MULTISPECIES: metallophosphoesterase [unclassified Modestobacter]MCZ2822828.1 metallophosphoesterase [Modestobacter sp. VKM Ac-2981]MCZ2851074.1 metallophosphoesterase [Modestobacter sp. VKM Ac-2982]